MKSVLSKEAFTQKRITFHTNGIQRNMCIDMSTAYIIHLYTHFLSRRLPRAEIGIRVTCTRM